MNKIDEVLVALRRVIRATDLHSRHLIKTTGLTAPQILLLQAIKKKEQITIGELATSVSLSQATVTVIVDRLENRGLLTREKSAQDKRKVLVKLTDTGSKVLASAPTPLQEEFARQFEKLHEWEQSMIISSLQRIAQMMNAESIDASPVLDLGSFDQDDT